MRTPEPVSPELVLVDPELAVRERGRLPERVVGFERVRAETPTLHQASDQPRRATATPALAPVDGRARSRRRRSWRIPAGVAAAIVTGLLLLDVRVEVGRSPAAAETALAPPSPSPASATPLLPSGPQPEVPQPEVRRFAWAAVKNASGYHVEIRRGPSRIFVRETRKPEVTVPRTWRLEGHTETLRPGEYRWYVWPIVSGLRAARAVVQASLSIPAA